MIYQFQSRVRYSEVDLGQKLTLSSIVNYFQDCTTFHSQAIGRGIEVLKEKDRAWMLSSWQIDIGRLPVFGEEITVRTWPYEFKGFYGGRNFEILSEEGTQMIAANSLWVFVDLTTGHPAKITEEEVSAYPLEEKLPMEYAPRKIALPAGGELKEGFQVQKYHLDTNYHVNNGQYIQMAEAFLPEQFLVKRMRAEYKRAAKLGDSIIPRIVQEEEGCMVALENEEGKPYAVVEFS